MTWKTAIFESGFLAIMAGFLELHEGRQDPVDKRKKLGRVRIRDESFLLDLRWKSQGKIDRWNSGNPNGFT